MAVSRLDFETLIPGTDEVVVFAMIPNNDLMAMGKKARGTVLRDHPLVDMQGSDEYAGYILAGYENAGAFVRANFVKDYGGTNPETGRPR